MGLRARSTLHEGFKQVEGMERELKIKVRLLDTFTETFFLPNHCFILNSPPLHSLRGWPMQGHGCAYPMTNAE